MEFIYMPMEPNGRHRKLLDRNERQQGKMKPD